MLFSDEIFNILTEGRSFVRDIPNNEQHFQLVLLAVVDVLAVEVHQAGNDLHPQTFEDEPLDGNVVEVVVLNLGG